MKYAFIALIACYLLVYGCGPDTSKKTEDKEGQTVHSTVKKPVVAAVATPQPAQQTITAPPSQVVAEASQQAPVIALEQKPGEGARELQPPCPMMVPRQGAVELTQPDENNIVVMPCGCMFIKHQIPANAPCLKQQGFPCPMMGAKQSAAEEELIMMPCGRIFVRQPMPVDDPDLELPQLSEMPCQGAVESQVVEDPEDGLATAVQKMAEATNDMVLVTKQLLVATQEMLKATTGTTGEVANTNKGNAQTVPAAQSTLQAAEAGTKKQTAVVEQEVVNAMKDAVIATQRALEIMNQSVPKTLEPKQ